jgi:hypothetical protein
VSSWARSYCSLVPACRLADSWARSYCSSELECKLADRSASVLGSTLVEVGKQELNDWAHKSWSIQNLQVHTSKERVFA